MKRKAEGIEIHFTSTVFSLLGEDQSLAGDNLVWMTKWQITLVTCTW